MKILFANIPWWESDKDALRQGIRAGSRWPFTRHAFHRPDAFEFGGYLPFPFFLGHAATHTKMLLPDSDVEIRDSIARGESEKVFCDYIASSRPDWVVLETATPALEHDCQFIAELGLNMPKTKVVLCGPIDEKKYEELFWRYENIHAIVEGEYDKQIAKSIGLKDRRVIKHDLLTTNEMNSAPPPMWDEACATHYWDACPKGQKSPQLQLWASRGCPYKCCFCVWPAVMTGHDPDGTKPRAVRHYSAAYVERHIRQRLVLHPYQSIYLDDDTFNLQDRHVLEICAVMNGIGLPWSAMCRADTIKKETWLAMKESGCFGVKIGFESGSQYVIDHIVNKKLDLKEAEETCKWLQSIGINIHTTWTVGLPGETKEQQALTLNTIERFYRLGVHTTHQLSGTAVVDGTPLDRIAHGEKLSKYDGATPDGFVPMSDGQRKIESMRE